VDVLLRAKVVDRVDDVIGRPAVQLVGGGAACARTSSIVGVSRFSTGVRSGSGTSSTSATSRLSPPWPRTLKTVSGGVDTAMIVGTSKSRPGVDHACKGSGQTRGATDGNHARDRRYPEGRPRGPRAHGRRGSVDRRRQLLVDVSLAGVNYRDVYEREVDSYGGPPPLVAGVEGAGTVAALGEGVTEFAVGDRVAWAGAG
jgi:hypothetical protein